MSASLIAFVTLIYVGVAVNEMRLGNAAMAIVYGGYSLANIGLVMVAMRGS